MRGAVLRRIGSSAVAMSIALAFGGTAALAAYPEKPVKWVVGFAPGGGADITARQIAQKLSEKWGQPVVIENKPGAAGTIAADIVAKSPPDGYTLDFATLNHTVTPHQRSLNFDPLKSFAPVILIGQHPGVLVVNPSLPVNSLEEFIAYAKKNPGKLNFGSTGSDAPWLLMELLKKAAGIDLKNVNYLSAAPVIVAVLGNEVQAAFSGVEATAELVNTGKLKAFAVSSNKRVPLLPNIPTLAESGLMPPNFNEGTWYGVLVAAGTPPDIVNKLNADIAEVLRQPDLRNRMLHQGFMFTDNTPAEFGAMLQNDSKKWGDLFATSKPAQ